MNTRLHWLVVSLTVALALAGIAAIVASYGDWRVLNGSTRALGPILIGASLVLAASRFIRKQRSGSVRDPGADLTWLAVIMAVIFLVGIAAFFYISPKI